MKNTKPVANLTKTTHTAARNTLHPARDEGKERRKKSKRTKPHFHLELVQDDELFPLLALKACLSLLLFLNAPLKVFHLVVVVVSIDVPITRHIHTHAEREREREREKEIEIDR